MSNRSTGTFCIQCGAEIDPTVSFCPSCGERTGKEQSSPEPRQPQQRRSTPQSRNRPVRSATQDIGFIFAFVDSWKRQRIARKLVNIVLVFFSLGTFLAILLLEGLIHYHNLNTGKSTPYDDRYDRKLWTTLQGTD